MAEAHMVNIQPESEVSAVTEWLNKASGYLLSNQTGET